MQYNYSERSEARSTSRKLIHNFVARNVESIGPAQKLTRGCSTPYEFLTSLIVGSKFTVFALFYFVFEGNFPSTSPRGVYIWRGDLTEGFLRYLFGGLILNIHGGAYFRNFKVIVLSCPWENTVQLQSATTGHDP